MEYIWNMLLRFRRHHVSSVLGAINLSQVVSPQGNKPVMGVVQAGVNSEIRRLSIYSIDLSDSMWALLMG